MNSLTISKGSDGVLLFGVFFCWTSVRTDGRFTRIAEVDTLNGLLPFFFFPFLFNLKISPVSVAAPQGATTKSPGYHQVLLGFIKLFR